ncbi:transport integral membrane protein [Streptomyces sp. F-3]|uniref:Copper resistance protein CopC n=1 Tax=Streptomyces thermogriseus TaxID=75292 RepID=A0ABN1T5Y2_9ACTN|nr:transport integral membrane protein [Streptomyces sp. F-3]
MLTLLGAVLALLLLGGAAPAFAHADLRKAEPADGTVLKSAPSTITLTYSEPVALLDDSFRLFDPEGRRVRTKPPRHVPGRPNAVRVEFPKGLGEGTFTVAWRVISADSHPASGAFTFSVGKPSPAAPAVDTGPDQHPVTGNLYDLGRYTAYGAAALLIGMVAFVLLCRPPDPRLLRGPLLVSWWAALVSTLVLLVLRAPYEAGTGPLSAFDPAAVSRTLSSRPGLVLTARLVLLVPMAVLLVRLFRRPPGQRPTRATLAAGAAPALALALTLAASEHASAGIQVPVALTSSTLHVLAMGIWLGGLTALLTILQRVTEDDEPRAAAPAGDSTADGPDRSQEASRKPSRDVLPAGDGPALTAAVARFSRIALGAVTVLAATGIYQSWRGLGSWAALTGTAYGRLLLVKVAAVVLMLAAAVLSRRWTARLVAVDAGDGKAAVRAEKPRTAARVRVPEPAGGKRPSGTEGSGTEETGTEEPGAGEAAAGEVLTEETPAGETAAGETPAGKAPAGEPVSSPAPGVCRRALRRSVLAELAVGIAVLVVTTILVGTLPGRVAAEAEDAPPAAGAPGAALAVIPFDVGTPGGRGKAQVTLVPGRVGQNAVEAVVYGPDGGLSVVPELRLSLSLPERKLGPIDVRLTKRGGYWSSDTLNVPLAGEWTMKATVRVSEIDQVSAEQKIRILR